jgi:hypothetical protein
MGRAVLARWKAANFSRKVFPSIAKAVLEEMAPAENLDMTEFIREFLLDEEQPMQTPSGFGQPELVVYEHPRFYIQLLFWLDGTTDIHQHQFSGAFHVMEGSSLHSLFEFETAAEVTAHLKLGTLRMKETRLLELGSTVPIVSGPGYIHSLFHLDTPSVTVVVRTHNDPGASPQFTYLPPHVAVDPLLDDALTRRRKQLLDVMEKTYDPAYPELVVKMVRDLDFERGFFTLQNGIGYLREIGAWLDALDAFQTKHGELARYVAPTLEEIVRRDGLVALRTSIEDIDLRFFLALLLNVPRREDLLKMIAQRYAGDPVKTILGWAEELCDVSEFGVWLLDAEFPEDLEMPGDDHSGRFLKALASLISGKKSAKKEHEKFRETFERSSWKVLL